MSTEHGWLAMGQGMLACRYCRDQTRGLSVDRDTTNVGPVGPSILVFPSCYPCWVLGRDDFIFLSSWRDGEWKIGKGIAADASEITHYQFLQAPPPPTNQMNSEKNEVIYADL